MRNAWILALLVLFVAACDADDLHRVRSRLVLERCGHGADGVARLELEAPPGGTVEGTCTFVSAGRAPVGELAAALHGAQGTMTAQFVAEMVPVATRVDVGVVCHPRASRTSSQLHVWDASSDDEPIAVDVSCAEGEAGSLPALAPLPGPMHAPTAEPAPVGRPAGCGGAERFVPVVDELDDLDGWTRVGRQAGDERIELHRSDGGSMAYIRHRTHTEVGLERVFPYASETFVDYVAGFAATARPAPRDFYAWAAVRLRFEDEDGGWLGSYTWGVATSDLPFAVRTAPPDLAESSPGDLAPRTIDVDAVAAALEIPDEACIHTVALTFFGYGSGWIYDLTAEVWIDRVEIR